jgi:hypothetical protein
MLGMLSGPAVYVEYLQVLSGKGEGAVKLIGQCAVREGVRLVFAPQNETFLAEQRVRVTTIFDLTRQPVLPVSTHR